MGGGQLKVFKYTLVDFEVRPRKTSLELDDVGVRVLLVGEASH